MRTQVPRMLTYFNFLIIVYPVWCKMTLILKNSQIASVSAQAKSWLLISHTYREGKKYRGDMDTLLQS